MQLGVGLQTPQLGAQLGAQLGPQLGPHGAQLGPQFGAQLSPHGLHEPQPQGSQKQSDHLLQLANVSMLIMNIAAQNIFTVRFI